MAKKKDAGVDSIQFEACLKQSSPSSKPIKFGAEGDSEITLEVPASEMVNVVRMLTMLGETFMVKVSKV